MRKIFHPSRMILVLSGTLMFHGLASISFAAAPSCSSVLRLVDFNKPFYQRGAELPELNLRDTVSYLREYKRAEILGRVSSKFDRSLDTRIYFTNTAVPVKAGKGMEQPMIDPEAKAVFVFFHGSGTMQSGGKNFYGIMNSLASMGYAALSFDLPYHAEGPNRPAFQDAKYFMAWVEKIMSVAKQNNQRVVMVGHSFGPDVIAEFLYRNPKGADAAVMLSPAGFNKVLEDWYFTRTAKMSFGGDVPSNQVAGEWSDTVSRQFIWKRGLKHLDPTLLNPQLEVRMLSGNMEEYVPAPVGGSKKTPVGPNTYDIGAAFREHFAQANVTIEKGVGHYIFNHLDQNGHNIVMREILASVGESAAHEKQLKKDYGTYVQESRNDATRMMHRFSTDRIFAQWMVENHPQGFAERIFKMNDAAKARRIMQEHDIWREAREREVMQEIAETESTMPRFYNQYRTNIETMKASKKFDATLFIPYLEAKGGGGEI